MKNTLKPAVLHLFSVWLLGAKKGVRTLVGDDFRLDVVSKSQCAAPACSLVGFGNLRQGRNRLDKGYRLPAPSPPTLTRALWLGNADA
jgi:hypothetical protein